MTHQPPALLLDLDGTIADTLPHLFAAFRNGVQPLVRRPPTDAEILATFGPAERECLRRMLIHPEVAKAGAVAQLDEAHARFHAYYEGGHEEGVRPFPGVHDLVQLVRDAGWRVGVFTGKGRRSALFTLERLGLLNRVDALITSDEVKRPKPDPEGVLLAAAALGTPAGSLIFVGDTPADVLAGRAAGTRTVAALWGAYDRAATLAAGPDWAFDSITAFCDAIRGGVVRTTL
jgi:2-phosphoglycolate phosphatase